MPKASKQPNGRRGQLQGLQGLRQARMAPSILPGITGPSTGLQTPAKAIPANATASELHLDCRSQGRQASRLPSILCPACEHSNYRIKHAHKCSELSHDWYIYNTAVQEQVIICTCPCHGMSEHYKALAAKRYSTANA